MTETTVKCNSTVNNKGYYRDITKFGYFLEEGWDYTFSMCYLFCCLICMLITGLIISSSVQTYTAANIGFIIFTIICFGCAIYNYIKYLQAKNKVENTPNADGIPQLPCVNKDGTLST